MIDAINSTHSSNYTGKLKSQKYFRRNDYLIRNNGNPIAPQNENKNIKKQSTLNSLLVISGGAAAISIITDILIRASGLTSAECSAEAAKSIFKTAGIMAIIGAALFGGVKLLENTVLKKICE